MAVITPEGIVGKLRDVFPTTAEVLEINDQSSGAGVVLSTTRIRAILRGTISGRAQIGNLTADSRIKPGEPVVTSGGDQVYPRGLAVGFVQSIAPDPDRQPYTAIVVRPAVDLDRVEEVLVITGTQSTLPADAQQDLAAAQAQHAADISAEKLPGLHDDDAQSPATAAPAAPSAPGTAAPIPPLVIPHPLPTLHSDRYTSGSTPPASELRPGVPVTPAATAQPAPGSGSKPASPQPDATK
jgi:rod shape-determining protein MreC